MNFLDIKKQHRSVFLLKFDKKDVVLFKPLTYSEFKYIKSLLSVMPQFEQQIRDDIFAHCILDTTYPYKLDPITNTPVPNYDMIPGGIVDTIVSVILRLSGSSSTGEFFQDISDAREYNLMDAESRILGLVNNTCKVSNQELQNMYWDEILMLIANTELIIAGQIPNIPFSPAEIKTNKIDFKADNQYDLEG